MRKESKLTKVQKRRPLTEIRLAWSNSGNSNDAMEEEQRSKLQKQKYRKLEEGEEL